MKNGHNEWRQKVAQAKLDKTIFGDLLGTDSMNRVSNLDVNDVKKLEEQFQFAMDEWVDSVTKPLNKDVVYNDVSMAPFAKMIYYKTVSLGCAYTYCKSKIAIACVYGDALIFLPYRPKLGEKLYLPSETGKGCTNAASCEKVVPGAKCEKKVAEEKNLCTTDASQITTVDYIHLSLLKYDMSMEEEAKAYASECPLAGSPSSDRLTGENFHLFQGNHTIPFMNAITNAHQSWWSQILKNGVNGQMKYNEYLETKPEAPTSFTQKYDMSMEEEAKAYASECPLAGSPSSDRLTGENFHLFQGNHTIPFMNAITNAHQSWWSQILKNGVNGQMKYNEYLETKPEAPTSFTQMAWANSYLVGCAVHRCQDVGTVVVCRYSPRGNIYKEYIYNKGPVCGACTNACEDGLCPPPN
ncbi:SCP-like protein [Ancylostoma ceylanicum]|uniref:SCP-like protein n=1 Tax=Ancylostoma ceylanicum TaxID=53326 RepID=A0A0D6M9W1_9BILA|nr:SCP-like protein [Ancylostoma ceylanicum]